MEKEPITSESLFMPVALTRTNGVVCSALMIAGNSRLMREITLQDVANLSEVDLLKARGGGPQTVKDAQRVLALAGLKLRT